MTVLHFFILFIYLFYLFFISIFFFFFIFLIFLIFFYFIFLFIFIFIFYFIFFCLSISFFIILALKEQYPQTTNQRYFSQFPSKYGLIVHAKCLLRIPFQRAHDVYTTSSQRRCSIDVEATLYRRHVPAGLFSEKKNKKNVLKCHLLRIYAVF